MNYGKLTKAELVTLAIMVLVVFAFTGMKNLADKNRNKRWSDDLAHSSIKECFGKSLTIFNNDGKNSDSDAEKRITDIDIIIHAATLIVNNLPTTELSRLRALITTGLERDQHGFYRIRKESIDAATQIISNFIQYNPEVGVNVTVVVFKVVAALAIVVACVLLVINNKNKKEV